MDRYKPLIGTPLRARDLPAQRTEAAHIGVAGSTACLPLPAREPRQVALRLVFTTQDAQFPGGFSLNRLKANCANRLGRPWPKLRTLSS